MKIQMLLLLSLLLVLSSCKEIIEKNITEDAVTMILPKSNDTIQTNPVHFKWTPLEGALSYRLEVVSPSFSNITTYDLDSIVTGSNFYFSLDSNSYEFRITALNGAYSSKTSNIIPFVVGTSVAPINAGVVLLSPGQGEYFNDQFNGLFEWYTLPGANSYTFEIHDGATFASPYLVTPQGQLGVTSTSVTGVNWLEGVYSWGVKAFLSNGFETLFSKRTFSIDVNDPPDASLQTPINNSTENAGVVSFNWTLASDIGTIQSPIQSILQIATNSSFSSGSLLSPDTVSVTNFSKTLPVGTYFWRIQTIDVAGNIGNTPTNYNILNIIP